MSGNLTLDTTTGTYNGSPAGPTGRMFSQGNPNPEVFVISVAAFAVNAGVTLRVVGSRPLLVLSRSTIDVAGTIDVSSNRTGGTPSRGAGANWPACDNGDPGAGATSSGGGGGGGFKNAGGAGGGGNGGTNMGGMFGGSRPAPTVVVSGCAGGDGGTGAGKGAGGASGGVIQLTAQTAISIAATAKVHAGGMGGGGAQGNGGGGGGGAGGFIGLDAPMVTVATGAVLTANGGGGGAGCAGGTGPSGSDASATTMRAPGGSDMNCNNGVLGGRGGALGTGASMDLVGEDGLDAASNESGGGGGGGVGYILVWAPAATLQFDGTASPAFTPMP